MEASASETTHGAANRSSLDENQGSVLPAVQLRRNDFGSLRRRTPQSFGANGGLPAALQGGQAGHAAFAHNSHGKSDMQTIIRDSDVITPRARSGLAGQLSGPAGTRPLSLAVAHCFPVFPSLHCRRGLCSGRPGYEHYHRGMTAAAALCSLKEAFCVRRP